MLVNSTTVKAHKAAAGQKKHGQAEALGCSRGGFGTKVHAVVDVLGTCLYLLLTPAQEADSPVLPVLLAALRQCPRPSAGAQIRSTLHSQHKVGILAAI